MSKKMTWARLPQAGIMVLSAVILVAATLAFPPKAAAVSGYLIKNRHSGKCLAVANGSTLNNARIIQAWCSGMADDQYWMYEYFGGKHRLVNSKSGKCMTPAGGATGGAQLVLYSCDNFWPTRDDQYWMYQYVQTSNPYENWHRIKAHYNQSMCVGVAGAATYSGANVVQWTCNSSNDQIWWPAAGA